MQRFRRSTLAPDRDMRRIAEAAKGIVWAATLADDGLNGGFFRDGQPLSC